MAYEGDELLDEGTNQEYKYGFVTNIESDKAPKGLNEDTIRLISAKKKEPVWLLEWRLKALKVWQGMTEPEWAHVNYPKVDFQDLHYYAAPKPKKKLNSLDEVDPELLDTFKKLGISTEEQKRLTGVAVDIVMDSVSVKTTFKEKLAELNGFKNPKIDISNDDLYTYNWPGNVRELRNLVERVTILSVNESEQNIKKIVDDILSTSSSNLTVAAISSARVR